MSDFKLKNFPLPIGKTNLNKDIMAERIQDIDDLKSFLYNIYGPQDECLTLAGLLFLEEKYGLPKIAELVLEEKREGVDYHFTNAEDIIEWLQYAPVEYWPTWIIRKDESPAPPNTDKRLIRTITERPPFPLPIGITNMKENIMANSITSDANLKKFLHDIYSPQNTSLTLAGLLFLEEKYGLPKIAELVLEEKRNGADYRFMDKEEVIEWLRRSPVEYLAARLNEQAK